MFGKTRIPKGAREKIETARQMQKKGYFESGSHGCGGETRYPSQTFPVTLIFAFAVILAFLLTGGTSNPLAGMHFTGINSIDSFITGTDIRAFTADPDQNKVLTIMGRGLAFFALAGLVPFIAFVLQQLFFKRTVMPLVLCWGVFLILIILYLFVPAKDVIPFIKSF